MTGASVRLILLANIASTLMMTGLIWFVQIVHYPLFARVGTPDFAEYEVTHSRRTGFVVGPLMLIEAASAFALVFAHRSPLPARVAWAGLALVAVIWLSTLAIQIPCHNTLQAGFNSEVQRRLVRSNWIRTAAWSLRSGLALFLISQPG